MAASEALKGAIYLSPDGSVTSPAGWRAGVTACGLRDGPGPDLTLVTSSAECSAAGLFTRNVVAAAPVQVDRSLLQANPAQLRAVVINAGVANACTGEQGLLAVKETQAAAAAALACLPDQVLVMSTGVIGTQLDLERVRSGIRHMAGGLSRAKGVDAAHAIMTTDTYAKHLSVHVEDAAGDYTIGAIAKGAGMIHPDMATMLALITTDAAVEASQLNDLLARAVESSFHRISVDGDTSTNDTVLLLANGRSGVQPDTSHKGAFARALGRICHELAMAIVRDGEGATRFVQLHISGARSQDDALAAARAIATSPLVKTALAGGDPNWGRILAAAGRSGARLDPVRLTLRVIADDSRQVTLVRDGTEVEGARQQAAALFQAAELCLRLDLGIGHAETRFWTTDLTHDYVTINADYHT